MFVVIPRREEQSSCVQNKQHPVSMFFLLLRSTKDRLFSGIIRQVIFFLNQKLSSQFKFTHNQNYGLPLIKTNAIVVTDYVNCNQTPNERNLERLHQRYAASDLMRQYKHINYKPVMVYGHHVTNLQGILRIFNFRFH